MTWGQVVSRVAGDKQRSDQLCVRILLRYQEVSSLTAGAYPRNSTPYTRHLTPYTLHPTPYTLHPTPYTLHPIPYSLHPTPYTQNQT